MYKECVCTVRDKSPYSPKISFRESDFQWSGGGFRGGGVGYSHFGVTLRENESENAAVHRMLNKEVKKIESEIKSLERKRVSYIRILDKYST